MLFFFLEGGEALLVSNVQVLVQFCINKGKYSDFEPEGGSDTDLHAGFRGFGSTTPGSRKQETGSGLISGQENKVRARGSTFCHSEN